MSFKKKILSLSAFAALCATPAISGPYFANKPFWAYGVHDFSASSSVAGHLACDTWTTPGGSVGTKYMTLNLSQKLSGAGQCYGITIEDQGATDNPDLRFWTPDNRSIDDDGPSPSRMPRARFWITSDFILKISAYNSGSNSVDFGIYNYLESATSAATCDDGVTPFYNQATNTILRANSRVN